VKFIGTIVIGKKRNLGIAVERPPPAAAALGPIV